MRRKIPLIPLLAALVLAMLGTPASADMTTMIIRDCQHSETGYLTGRYTKAQLREAKNNLPSDVLEYSGCYDQILQALREPAAGNRSGGGGDGGSDGIGGSSTGGGPSGDGGAAPASPAVRHTGTKEPVRLAGATVKPGSIPAIGRDAHELPTPLLVLLVLLCLGALGGVTTTIVQRVVARRRA
jgi:hypothetical protein